MEDICYLIDSPSVIYENFEGELVAINLDTGAYHSLTGSGADTFLLLTEEATPREVAEVLQSKYDATADTICESLIPFFQALETEKLIARVDVRRPHGPLQLAVEKTKLPFVGPTLQAYHDLQSLFLLDPVHEVDEQGWPQALDQTKSAGDDVQ
jgi:Coenzyme PQQ synthesis protein D (PqqD)